MAGPDSPHEPPSRSTDPRIGRWRAWLDRLSGASGTSLGVALGADAVVGVARSGEAHGKPRISGLHVVPCGATPASRLAGLRAVAAALGRGRTTLVLPPDSYELHQVSAPPVPAEELREAVRWQLRGLMRVAPAEAVLDIAELPTLGGGGKAVLAAVAPLAEVDELCDLCERAGLTLGAVDIPEFAVRNVAPVRSDAPTGFLAFEPDGALLTLQRDGMLLFARRMALPALTSTDADAAGPSIQRLVSQVVRTLDLFERQAGCGHAARVTIAPHRTAHTLAPQLADRAAVATDIYDPLDLLAIAPRAAAQLAHTPAALLALGAALRPDGAAARTATAAAATSANAD